MMNNTNQFENDHKKATYESLINIGLTTIKFNLFSNGTALIVMLNFLSENSEKIQQTKNGILIFIFGVSLSLLSCIIAYLMQLKLHNENIGIIKKDVHVPFLYLAIFFVFFSSLCFLLGSFITLIGLK